MAEEPESERIKRLQLLCDRLDALRKQADQLCKSVTTEIRRAQTAGQQERRIKARKVKSDRRLKA